MFCIKQHFDIYKFEFKKKLRKEKILFFLNQQLYGISKMVGCIPEVITLLLTPILTYVQGASEKTRISESQCIIFIFRVKYHPQKHFYTKNKPLSNVIKVT